jgi:hypothetical protein
METTVVDGTAVAKPEPMAKPKKKGNGHRPEAIDVPGKVGADTVAGVDRDRVAMRAYELYQSRGGGDGMAMEDWLAAEREFSPAGGRKVDHS